MQQSQLLGIDISNLAQVLFCNIRGKNAIVTPSTSPQKSVHIAILWPSGHLWVCFRHYPS